MENPPEVNEIFPRHPSLFMMFPFPGHIMNRVHIVRRRYVTVHDVMGQVNGWKTVGKEENLVVDFFVAWISLLWSQGLVHQVLLKIGHVVIVRTEVLSDHEVYLEHEVWVNETFLVNYFNKQNLLFVRLTIISLPIGKLIIPLKRDSFVNVNGTNYTCDIYVEILVKYLHRGLELYLLDCFDIKPLKIICGDVESSSLNWWKRSWVAGSN